MALRTIKSGSIKNYSITGDNIADGSFTLDYLPNNVSYPILVSNIIYTDLNFTNTASNSTSSIGGFIKLLGSGFSPNTNVYIGDVLLSTTNVIYVSNSVIHLSTPNLATGTYNLIAVKPDGTTSIRMNSITLVDPSFTMEYLVVAGGGSGGSSFYAAGGGAGGYREGNILISGANFLTNLAVIVGAGGSSLPADSPGTNGSNSSFITISATGGGREGARGGSSGGGTGAAGNLGGYTPAEGSAGGTATSDGANYVTNGGGGGAGGAGSNGNSSSPWQGGVGGPGRYSTISGSNVAYAGGGGGGAGANSPRVSIPSSGGVGGGGTGGSWCSGGMTSGNVNTGGGGGGGAGSARAAGCPGGSGIVILSYSGAQKAIGGNVTTCLGKTIHTFTSSGNLCITG